MIRKYLTSQHKDIIQLLSLTLGKNNAWLFANDNYQLNKDEIQKLNVLIKNRANGMPFAYLSGTKGFYHLDFKVTTDTLIPRPETELLIDIALNLFTDNKEPYNILDLGTGSGIIAITLADKNPHWQVSATDFSQYALEVAKKNSTNDINFQQGSWFDAVPKQRFDLIISNPPYIKENDPHLLKLKYEPISALVSGKDGLDDIRLIIKRAHQHINKRGYLLLEHGYNQQEEIISLLQEKFSYIKAFKDYNFKNRAILSRLK